MRHNLFEHWYSYNLLFVVDVVLLHIVVVVVVVDDDVALILLTCSVLRVVAAGGARWKEQQAIVFFFFFPCLFPSDLFFFFATSFILENISVIYRLVSFRSFVLFWYSLHAECRPTTPWTKICLFSISLFEKKFRCLIWLIY